MNERIQELEKQSYIEVMHEMGGKYTTFDKEKFAELIVKECAYLTKWDDFDMCYEQRVRLAVYQDILKHFGVKE
jgi:hypothetical protein